MPHPTNPRVRELAGFPRKTKHGAANKIHTTCKVAQPIRLKQSAVARKLALPRKNQKASGVNRRLTRKEIDVYLSSHKQSIALKGGPNKATREKLRQMGLGERSYREQKDVYEAVLSKTCAIAVAAECKNIDLTPYVDQSRVESAGSFSCCGNTESDPNMIQCSDPLCEIGSYHSICLWAVEFKNYKFHAKLPCTHVLKGRWMCGSCVAIRARSDFPELKPIVRELKRAAEGWAHNPADPSTAQHYSANSRPYH